MIKYFKTYILILTIICGYMAPAQDRMQALEAKLQELSTQIPGLKEPIDFSVSGVSIQEFLRGMAETNRLNISVDPGIDVKIFNNFSNETALNVLLFLCKEYSLDIRNVGSILSVVRYIPPAEEKPLPQPKEIVVKYNTYGDLLTLDLRNDTLDAVARKITQVSKKNVILSSGLRTQLVNGYVEDMPFDGALQKFAYSNKLKVSKTTDNFYVLKTLEESDEPLSVVEEPIVRKRNKKTGTPGAKPNTPGMAGGQGTAEQFLEVEIIGDSLSPKLINLEAVSTPISEIIKSVTDELAISYFLYSDIKGSTTIRVSNVSFEQLLTHLLNGSDYTYKKDGGIFLIGERKLEGLRANKVVQLHFRSLESVQETIPAELKKGVELREFKELNSVLLSGSSPQINEIEAFIKQIDRVVPMVLIEVIMMDVRKAKTVSTGITAGIDSSAKTGGSIFPSLDATFSSKSINEFLSFVGVNNLFNLGKVSPKFYVSLKALEDNSNVELRSMPKLSTLNGHDANLSIGTTTYYYVETQNTLGTLTTSVVKTRQWNPIEANLSINFKPMVSGDDQVTMEVSVNISDFLGAVTNDAPPSSSKSQFKSIIRVKNEDMVVLGGIERTEKSDKGTGVPILSRIPVLKWLFSSRTKSRSKVVSVVFIKPTIIY